MFRVEYLNDHGDWILISRHKWLENAETMAECTYKQYEKRIVEDKNGDN